MLIVLYATEALCNIGEYALAIDLLSTPCLAVSKESTSSLTLRESLNQLILKSDSTCSTQRVTVLCECIGLSNQALILALQGKFQPAKDLLLLALGMEPTFYPAITLLISIYLRTKQYPAALSALRRYGSESSAP
jgi:tetratricopeptide (TPR) repeat protein